MVSWRDRTTFEIVKGNRPENGELSPNNAYLYLLARESPNFKITIYAEKDHLIEIIFADLPNLNEVRWINEKLLFMRPWWGRIVATDIIYDVEKEIVIYAEPVSPGQLSFTQARESCPLVGGCECIKKD